MSTRLQTVVLDRSQLRQATLEDEVLMRELVAALIDDTSRQIGLLARAIEEQDGARCLRLAHSSKGACANVGAARAAAILKDIENQAGRGRFSACDNALARLAREMNLLRAEAASL